MFATQNGRSNPSRISCSLCSKLIAPPAKRADNTRGPPPTPSFSSGTAISGRLRTPRRGAGLSRAFEGTAAPHLGTLEPPTLSRPFPPRTSNVLPPKWDIIPRAGIPIPAAREVCVSKPSAVTDRPWSSTAPPGEFRTYISADETLKEFTIRAVVLGALFGLLFGAITVYVGLRAGLTVSASIPISVLSISILRAFGRSTILENNIVQTTGSAGESLAAGVMFTIPALIFLGFGSEFTFWRIFPLALLGGWLGVLFMVPLRRQLIVKEHGNLAFPEGTACADVLGVGYIIGSRVSGILFAGGIISWLVIMPAIKFYGQLSGNTPIYPSTVPIPLMSPDQLWSN